KQLRNAFLLLLLSQGTPLIMAGDEFGNSQSGNNNAYCQDNEVSWLNWNLVKTNQDILEFVKAVIAFRKAHPVFHMPKEPRIMDYLACGFPDVSYHGVKAWCPEFDNYRRQLGIFYFGEYGRKPDGTADNNFYVAYNMHWEPHEFDLPNLPKKEQWHVVFHTDKGEENGMYSEGKEPAAEGKRFLIPPRSIVVFIGKK
ncbi:MAG: alpha amylase C-terminal domain-containing protein, partial [Lacrimispora sphenoides]